MIGIEKLLLKGVFILRKFYHKIWISCILFLSVGLWSFFPLSVYALPVLTDSGERSAIPIETNAVTNWPQGPDVTSQSAILIDADTGAILYAKNVHEQLYPASTTKILTCLIAAEECSMDEIVTFSHDAIFDTPRDSSHIALDEGNQLTMEQCLNAILIASANEVSFGVAEHITGTSWEDFAVLMNERAAELGCVDSHFVNPNGLPDEDHYTSAYDLARIGRAFFANELLCKISSSSRLDLPPTENQPKHIIENSKNQLLPGKPYAYEYLVGSKTGYTSAALSTLVSCAEKDGMKLIAVVMAADSPNQFADTVSLFNYGFTNFEKINISQTETRYNIDHTGVFYSNNDIFGNSRPILSLDTEDCIILPKTIPFSDLTSTISYDTVQKGEAAQITYYYEEQFLGSVSINFTDTLSDKDTFTENGIQSDAGEDTAAPTQPKIIFVNVFKILLGLLLFAGLCILIIMLHSFFTNYQFSSGERNNRKSWQKARRKKRRRRRPNRFKDFDF